MRHRKKGKQLGRTSSHRVALRRNLVSSLFLHERVRTTKQKAKECRAFAERLITLGKEGSLASFRRAIALLGDKEITRLVFRDIAPRYLARSGGYTRILKLPISSNRLGDNAQTVIFELVEADESKAARGAGTEKMKLRERLKLRVRRRKPKAAVATEPETAAAAEPEAAAAGESETSSDEPAT